MTKITKLHEHWLSDPAYRRAYDAAKDEYRPIPAEDVIGKLPAERRARIKARAAELIADEVGLAGTAGASGPSSSSAGRHERCQPERQVTSCKSSLSQQLVTSRILQEPAQTLMAIRASLLGGG